MKIERLKVAVAIYLNGGCEDYELLEAIAESNEDEPQDVAEFIAQLVASDYAEDLEEIIDAARNKRVRLS